MLQRNIHSAIYILDKINGHNIPFYDIYFFLGNEDIVKEETSKESRHVVQKTFAKQKRGRQKT